MNEFQPLLFGRLYFKELNFDRKKEVRKIKKNMNMLFLLIRDKISHVRDRVSVFVVRTFLF